MTGSCQEAEDELKALARLINSRVGAGLAVAVLGRAPFPRVDLQWLREGSPQGLV